AEPVTRRVELLFKDVLVVLVDLDQRLVTKGIEERLHHGLEDRGLDGEGLGPRRLHQVNRLSRLRLGTAAAVERLGQTQIKRPGLKGRKNIAAASRAEITPLDTALTREGNRWPPIGQRLRYPFI